MTLKGQSENEQKVLRASAGLPIQKSNTVKLEDRIKLNVLPREQSQGVLQHDSERNVPLSEAMPRASKTSSALFPFSVRILSRNEKEKAEEVKFDAVKAEQMLLQAKKENDDLKMNLKLNKESLQVMLNEV